MSMLQPSSASSSVSSSRVSSGYAERYLPLASAAFLPAAAQLAVVVLAGSLALGIGQGSAGFTALLTMAAVFHAPAIALVFGALIALAYVLPVIALADRAAAHRGGAVRWWRAAFLLGLGALYAVPFGFGSPADYLQAWGLVALSAVLPLRAADRAHRNGPAGASRTRLAPWLWGFAALWLLTVVIGFAAMAAP
ncbi:MULTISPECIES: hypothetical protein [Streptomyces]|uniref:Uncharacterized protein n=1 Tax=Streptomyces tsukubensis (strain DSM 42081 / NBRC 108919 / NRRL 18488 / 9993) TaxID=1114943 RepID=A0A7G3UIS3_STRT9|nr:MULTISPECIES: hypothetical protein [Streptomyces]MYS63896.1 hypothetical protein [Streptomyces sp. SID5473]QKM69229.1 hypothetical protein STSU_020730 [Streptomyces tsukubensis NRRL18488]TAI42841.1 hypothetical protein EWI31_20805 [Streptomyces tsukubensis]